MAYLKGQNLIVVALAALAILIAIQNLDNINLPSFIAQPLPEMTLITSTLNVQSCTGSQYTCPQQGYSSCTYQVYAGSNLVKEQILNPGSSGSGITGGGIVSCYLWGVPSSQPTSTTTTVTTTTLAQSTTTITVSTTTTTLPVITTTTTLAPVTTTTLPVAATTTTISSEATTTTFELFPVSTTTTLETTQPLLHEPTLQERIHAVWLNILIWIRQTFGFSIFQPEGFEGLQ